MVQHWNGVEWSIVPSPNVITGTNSGDYLKEVDAVASDNVWAVGEVYWPNGSPPYRTLIEHWDGIEWEVVPSPNPNTSTNTLTSVDAASSDDIWAVGTTSGASGFFTLLLHWDGTEWSTVEGANPSPTQNQLEAVKALSTNDVWAVGTHIGPLNTFEPLTIHWDGTQWTNRHTQGPAGSVLYSIDGVASDDLWAVGYSRQGSLTMHWDGTEWEVVAAPQVGEYHFLYGVEAVAADDVWAVGYSSLGTLVIHWDGSEWSVVPSANPVGEAAPVLYDIDAVSSADIWSVGRSVVQFGGRTRTLIEHYSCLASSTPTPSPTVTPTSCTIQFTDVPSNHTFYPFIRCLACRGIISGYTSGCPSGNPCFRPENNVTRGQVAKIVSNSAGFSDPITNQSFEDVPVGSTFHEFVGRLAMRGIVGGYACGGAGEPCNPPLNLPYFRPNANVTRGQLAKMDSEAAGYSDVPSGQQFEDMPAGHTFYTYTYRLAIRTIMSGYACGGTGEPCNPPLNLPYFRPGNPATRGQTAKIVANTFYPNCNTPQR